MKAPLLKSGDLIGIISPCTTPYKEISQAFPAIEEKGFKIKLSKNLFKCTYGYAASERERADDFNEMVSDKDVKMIFFSGGDVCNEVLPFIDFDNIKQNPKIICSFSDGTTLTNAIFSKTSLITYYGQEPNTFIDLTDYNNAHFDANFISGDIKEFLKASEWKTIYGGVSEGILVGGYIQNFALLLGSKYFSYNPKEKYILFIEDHEKYSWPARVSMLLAHIEQSEFMKNVVGFIWGHYSEYENVQMNAILKRFGERNSIPMVMCDDFGHGKNHAVFPTGSHAKLDAENKRLLISTF